MRWKMVKVVGVGYVLLLLLYLLRFRILILQSDYGLLVMALGLFAVSAGIDIFSSALREVFPASDVLLMEDAPKLIGIATWLAYFARLNASVLRAIPSKG